MNDLWTDIPVAHSPASRTERLADPDHPLDFYRGRNFDGHYLFWIKVPWHDKEVPKTPAMAGIDIECSLASDGYLVLQLSLRDSSQKEIFRALCANLMEATRQFRPVEGPESVRAVIARLKRWQDLLGRRRSDLLSRQQIIGLVGELIFLQKYALSSRKPSDAVISWRGPFGDEQDFVFGNHIVEIKTQLITADRRLQITSEDQLDTRSGPIALIHELVGLSMDGRSGRSLNALVDEIFDFLSSSAPEAVDLFQAGLIEAGYAKRAEYDAEEWVDAGATVYEITAEFPRLTPEGLPEGVCKVRYEVNPAACASFERRESWLKEFISQ